MKLQAHFVADSVLFDAEGFVTVVRGGINQMYSDTFPAIFRFASLTRLWLTPDEAKGLVFLQTRVTLDDEEISASRQPVNVNPIRPDSIFANISVSYQLGLGHPGLLRIASTVTTADQEAQVLPLIDIPIERKP